MWLMKLCKLRILEVLRILCALEKLEALVAAEIGECFNRGIFGWDPLVQLSREPADEED